MNGMVSIGGIVKILETPRQRIFANNIVVTTFRVHLPQRKNTRIIYLTCWGNLARDVVTYYKKNDYLLVEGYLSIIKNKSSDSTFSTQKKIRMTAIKLYPCLSSKFLPPPIKTS
jgi:single-stranded DNA-binding protein